MSKRSSAGDSHHINHAENKIIEFVNRKSDLINSSKKQSRLTSTSNVDEDVYAITPPLGKFMKIDKKDGIEKFWNEVEINDVLIGQVSSVQERKFVIKLLCFDCGKSRHIVNYHLKAQCPVEEIPTKNNHDDPLSQIMNDQIIRARVIKVRPSQERIIVSLFSRPDKVDYEVKLGILDDDDKLPIAYKQVLSNNDSYNKALTKCHGFSNPNNIKFLLSKLGMAENEHCSLLKRFHTVIFPPSEFASNLRYRQCNKVAQKAVEKGIKKFKNEDYIEALNDFNYALEMDTENVDALVARGALYANRSSYLKAISDFKNALKIKPSHKNAKQYLTEVLVARGQKIELDIEDIEQVEEIEKCYKDALQHNPTLKDAIEGLKVVENLKVKFTKKNENEPARIPDLLKKETVDKNLAAKKIRQILERQISKKKEQSSSSSSSSSSDSESSSSSSSSNRSSSNNSTRKRRHSISNRRSKNRRSPCHKRRKSRSPSTNHRRKQSHSHSPKNNKRRPSPWRRSSQRSERRHSRENHNRSTVEAKFHQATIKSSGQQHGNPSNRRHSHNQFDRKKIIDRRHSLSTNAKITKDNVIDILSEINKYEKLTK